MSELLVVDASVVAKWYFDEVYSDACVRLLDSGHALTAPDLVLAQVGEVVARRARAGEIRIELAHRIAGSLRRLPLSRVPTESLLGDAVEIAAVSRRTLTESIYFALAIRSGSRIVTADRRWYGLLSTGSMRRYVAFVTDIGVEAARAC